MSLNFEISEHAKKRLWQRKRIRGDSAFRLISDALTRGRRLSQREAANLLNFSIRPEYSYITYTNLVLIFSESNSLITAIPRHRPRWLKPQGKPTEQ